MNLWRKSRVNNIGFSGIPSTLYNISGCRPDLFNCPDLRFIIFNPGLCLTLNCPDFGFNLEHTTVRLACMHCSATNTGLRKPVSCSGVRSAPFFFRRITREQKMREVLMTMSMNSIAGMAVIPSQIPRAPPNSTRNESHSYFGESFIVWACGIPSTKLIWRKLFSIVAGPVMFRSFSITDSSVTLSKSVNHSWKISI